MKQKMEADDVNIQHRQDLFCSTLKSHFLAKITKYQNILMKNGVHIYSPSIENLDKIDRSQSIDDHLELILGGKSVSPNAYKSLWKIGNRISIVRVFRWIYDMVQRTKSSRILCHLEGIPDCELQSTLLTVGRELAMSYEYQLYLLASRDEVVMLAQHAVLCMLAYLNTTDAHFRPEELIQAVVEVKPQSSHNHDIVKTRPVVHNGKPACFRWRLGQVFKQPGLRIPSITQESCSQKSAQESTLILEENNSKKIPSDHSITIVTTQEEQTSVFPDDTCIDLKNEIQLSSGIMKILEKDENGKIKVTRRISAIEMDYENGFMKVTDHYCEVSDFSPLETSAPLCSDEDDTFIDEDLSDVEAIDCNLDEIYQACGVRNSDSPIGLLSENSMLNKVSDNHDASLQGENTVENNKILISSDKPEEIFHKISENVPMNFPKKLDLQLSREQQQSPELCNTISTKTQQKEFSAHGSTVNIGKISYPSYKFYGCFTPYGAKCRPWVYGYRGPLHVWDEKEKKYSLIYNDSVTVATLHQREVPIDLNNFHQAYIPKSACEH